MSTIDSETAELDGDLYRILVGAITDYAIYMLNVRGEVISWNSGAERFKGYTAPEILGQHFSRFYTEEDLARNLPARALETARTEGRFEREGWRVRKDGSRFWAHVVIDAIFDDGGALIGYAKVTRDLTERRHALEALKLSEDQFRRLVQGVTDYAIYMLTPDGLVATWNAGAERIKGYTPSEIIGTSFSRFYTDADRAAGEPQRALDTARREGRFERESWRVRKDGTRFWANVVLDAIRDDEGRLIGFAKITRDVTERVNAQRQLEMAREALFQAQKMESIGQLTGGIAHDFNNLLAAIIGSLDLMRKRLPEDDPKILRLFDNAVTGAERGITLTRRMLAFARRQELKPTAVDLGSVVQGMHDLLLPSLGSQVDLEIRYLPLPTPAHTDPNQIETALLNLVVNARDAIPAGGGKVVISILEREFEAGEHDLPAGRYVCLAVEDNGTGMDAETLARATEPFYTTKGIGKGTGLGLSMVHGLAEQSHGKLLLKSTPGVGTTAELWLPVATSAPEKAPEVAPTIPGSPVGLRILAVDDDPLVLMNTVAMLEDLGHIVLEAHNGRQALEIALKGEPLDLVITDHAMPLMTGAELAAALLRERPGLPIVMASGYADAPPGGHVTAIRLTKPFREKELADAVRAAVCAASPGDGGA